MERPDEEALTRQRTEDLSLAQQRDKWQVLVKTLIVIQADALIFIFHRRIAKRVRLSSLA